MSYALIAGWLGVLGVFAWQRFGASRAGATMAQVPRGRHRFLVQAAGFALVWAAQRPHSGVLGTRPSQFDVALAGVVVALLGIAFVFVDAAVRTLGKQWALDARVLSDSGTGTHVAPLRWIVRQGRASSTEDGHEP